MSDVVNWEGRTARAFWIITDTQLMAGKTGSSQVFSISAAERVSGAGSLDDLPWNRREHALFHEFAPVEASQIAVSVLVEHGGGGCGGIGTDPARLSTVILPADTSGHSSHG